VKKSSGTGSLAILMLSHSADSGALSTVCVVVFVSLQLHLVFVNYNNHVSAPHQGICPRPSSRARYTPLPDFLAVSLNTK